MTEHAQQAAAYIAAKAPGFTPKLAIVLGSGLGVLAEHIEDPIVIAYEQLPGFPGCSVSGHGGNLFLGKIKGVPVACMQGRAHYYEGVDYDQIKTPMRTLKLLGCDTLLSTNASGSLRKEVTPGSLVLINDHINFQFNNPLVGANQDEFGPRFIGMEDIYDKGLREKIKAIAQSLDIKITEGVYFGVLGPSFETPAEIRAFRTLGGDVVGMSTIPEVIAAHHCGMKIAVIAAISNMAAGMSDEKLSHDVTLSGAAKATDDLTKIALAFIEQVS
ncbi:MAG: purine-nucleoside phosphorylase [Gammaproteobacteria bacterium]|nr:purine-nucleoside phosphorylase [Gammaproteobacteria bacterium]